MTEQQGNTKTLAREKVEWGLNLESEVTLKISEWPNQFIQKGRCNRCWGGLFGRTNDEGAITGIKCRACGTLLEGSDSEEEHKRMSEESGLNFMNMSVGRLPTYNEGTFAYKVFPRIERLTEKEFRNRIKVAAPKGGKRGRLTRSDFPAGTPGYFYLQATILMASLDQPANPRELSVAEFSEVYMKDDGTLVSRFSRDKLRESSWQQEYRLMGRLGATMSQSLMSAFACELAMKAISLTCNDEAQKAHDLMDLYIDLPNASRERIEADFPEIEDVLEQGRQIFDRWRYFQHVLSGKGMSSMIETERARSLGKAARVILDEGETMGLWGKVKMDAKRDVRVKKERMFLNDKISLQVTGGENPPKI